MKSASLFKSLCLYMAIALVALLAVGPFLHAHYGKSTVTGLHLAGVSSVTVAHEDAAVISFSQDEEHESPAVGVETSYARQVSMDVQEQPHMFLILAVFVVAAVVCSVSPRVWQRVDTRSTRLAFLPGLPVLAHAPPTFRF